MTTGPSNPIETMSAGECAAILHFYADAGVDCLLDDSPIDRFHESAQIKTKTARGANPTSGQRTSEALPNEQSTPPPQQSSQDQPTIQATQSAAIPNEQAIAEAREISRSVQSIDALHQCLLSFNGCNLRFGARNTVFADGNTAAQIMFIGEAPGRDEDRQGLPFVGRAGQLLDKMLAAIRFERSDVYITNMIPWRPPGNRTPTPLEIELCRPFIQRHIELVAPKIVVLLGNVSTKALLGTSQGILSLRGNWSEYRSDNDIIIPALPTLHPAYLLRNPAQKRQSWIDFLKLRERSDQISGS